MLSNNRYFTKKFDMPDDNDEEEDAEVDEESDEGELGIDDDDENSSFAGLLRDQVEGSTGETEYTTARSHGIPTASKKQKSKGAKKSIGGGLRPDIFRECTAKVKMVVRKWARKTVTIKTLGGEFAVSVWSAGSLITCYVGS